jgi:hypothetical protein
MTAKESAGVRRAVCHREEGEEGGLRALALLRHYRARGMRAQHKETTT